MSKKNSVNIIRPFIDAIATHGDIQIIGGIGAAALADKQTKIIPAQKLIIAAADLDVPQFREDGTKRDLDALVFSTDKARVKEVEEMAKQFVGNQLDISIFGLQPAAKLEDQKKNPLSIKTLITSVLGDRYVSDKNGRLEDFQKAAFPFAVDMHPATLETWSLSFGKDDPNPMPVPHPGTTLLNYLTRSVGGLRPKDEAKFYEMAEQIYKHAPEIRDWIMTGPGKSQLELAAILNQLGNNGQPIATPLLDVGGVSEDLKCRSEFILSGVPDKVQRMAIRQARFKARTMRHFETMQWFVTFWLKHMEHLKRIQRIVHND